MLLYFILFFSSILLYFFIFKTPFLISNSLFEFTHYRYIKLRYIINKENINYLSDEYNFKNINYDGKLISNIIKNSNFKTISLNKIENFKLYDTNNIVENILNLDISKFNNNYTHLANICSYIIKYVSINTKFTINICVIVSNRSDTNFNYGNYITFAFFKVYKTMDIEMILKVYKNEINNARNKELKYFSLYDIYELYNCDLILNSWRDLSEVNNKYSFNFKRYESQLLDKDTILDFLISYRKRKVVYLDYFDNKYIINKINF